MVQPSLAEVQSLKTPLMLILKVRKLIWADCSSIPVSYTHLDVYKRQSLYNMLNKTLDRSGSGTATISYTITPKGKDHKPLTRTNMFYSADSISEKAVDEFYNVIDVLMNNRFINYEIADITVETEVTQDKKTAKLIDASASSTVVSPGDTIVVDVTLEPFRGEKVVKQIFFKVPEDQAIGKYTLEVRGGGEKMCIRDRFMEDWKQANQ